MKFIILPIDVEKMMAMCTGQCSGNCMARCGSLKIPW